MNPACPRCGYDLSGAIASWERVEPPCCPLDGRCSECGLDFAWVDVMEPWRHQVDGLYEHARGLGQGVVWALRTWFAVWLPRRFWSPVPIVAPLVPLRLISWGLIFIGIPWAAGSLLHNAATLAAPRFPGILELFNDWARPIGEWGFFPSPTGSLTWRWRFSPVWMRLSPAAAMTALWPVLTLVLSDTMRAARVRRAHILRATIYALAWITPIAALRCADGVCHLANLNISPGARFIDAAWPVLLGALCLWLALWWQEALAIGFQLAQARLVGTVLLLPIVLAGLTTLAASGGLTQLFIWLNA